MYSKVAPYKTITDPLKKCKVVQEKKKAKEEKKFEKQKVKMYIFFTEYIFLKPKDQTNEHEKKTNEP